MNDADELRFLLKAEQHLVQKLRQTSPDFVRLESLRSTLETYRSTAAVVTPPPEPAPKPVAPPPRPPVIWHTGGTGKSMSALIIENAEAILRTRGAPALSGWIGEELAKRGVDIPKDRRSQRISAALSGNAKFVNVKGQGYGLKEWPLAAAEDPGTATGSQSHGSSQEVVIDAGSHVNRH